MTDIHSTIQAAGFVVTDNECIHGYGATENEAWADMLNTMEQANIILLDDDEDSSEQMGSWTRESSMTILPATAALIADVEAKGGAIGWRMVGEVACTRDEYEAG
jgi:hypothetical protein